MKNIVKVTLKQAMQVEARYIIGGTVRRLAVTEEFTMVDADWTTNALLLVSPEWYGPRFDRHVEANYGLGARHLDDHLTFELDDEDHDGDDLYLMHEYNESHDEQL